MMQIVIGNLHEDGARFGQQFPGQQQPVAQIGQVGMQAQFPGITVSLHHFRLADHFLVLAVGHVALAHEGLEVGAEFHAIRRIDIEHLHLAAQALVLQQRVHHLQRIAQNQAVGPRAGVLVGVQLVGDVQAGVAEQIKVGAAGLVAVQGFQNGLGRVALVHEQRQGGHRNLLTLGLARPVQERLGQAFQPRRALRQRTEGLAGPGPNPRLGKNRLAALRRLGDQVQQPFREWPLAVLVPLQLRRQARIVAIPPRSLASGKLLLHPHIRPLHALLLVPVKRGTRFILLTHSLTPDPLPSPPTRPRSNPSPRPPWADATHKARG